VKRAAAGSISVHVVRALVFGATSRGIDARSLAEGAGIPPELVSAQTLADPDGRVLARHGSGSAGHCGRLACSDGEGLNDFVCEVSGGSSEGDLGS